MRNFTQTALKSRYFNGPRTKSLYGCYYFRILFNQPIFPKIIPGWDVSEMTYTVSSGTLNSSIPYQYQVGVCPSEDFQKGTFEDCWCKIFLIYRLDTFLSPNQQCQSTEGTGYWNSPVTASPARQDNTDDAVNRDKSIDRNV